MYKEDLALNNQQRLICHKTKLNLYLNYVKSMQCIYLHNQLLDANKQLNRSKNKSNYLNIGKFGAKWKIQ